MKAGSDTWQSHVAVAILQLIAGDETVSRSTCIELTKRFGGETAADAAVRNRARSRAGGTTARRNRSPANDRPLVPTSPPRPSRFCRKPRSAARGRARTRRRLSSRRSRGSIKRPSPATVACRSRASWGQTVLAEAYHQQMDHAAVEAELNALAKSWQEAGAQSAAAQSAGAQHGLPKWIMRAIVEWSKSDAERIRPTPEPGGQPAAQK